jgi:hypothetical protein
MMYIISFSLISRLQDVENEHVYENAESEEPLYENCTVSVGAEEHIYEHVSYESPVNIFLGLLRSETETISPDPNIYEVPPGAIFNESLVNVEDSDERKLKPPEGFQDYENICWNPETDFDGEIFTLPVEVIYSTVVKPKRKKCRPHISIMLHEDDKASFNSVKGTNNEMSGITDIDMNNKNGFSGKVNADSHTQNMNSSTSSEHGPSHNKMSCSEASLKSDIINHQADCSDISLEDRSSDNKADDNVASCEGNKSNTPTDNYITSRENNSLDTKVNNSVDSFEYDPIKVNDNLLNSFGEDEIGITEFLDEIDTTVDNSVASCGNNADSTKLDNCVASGEYNFIDRKIDKSTISCGETEKLTEDHYPINTFEPESKDTRVDSFVTPYEDSSKDIDLQDNSIDIPIVSSEDTAVDANVDICLSTCGDLQKFVENDAAIITVGDSSDNGGNAEERMSLSNEISGSNLEEFPKSTSNTDERSGNESEIKIPDIPEKNYRNEDVACIETSVIEISEDGTWETKTLPPTELGQANQGDESQSAEQPEFLCAVDRSAETAKMAYGSQYYVNCPVASVKPMKHETAPGEGDDTARNIGAQIMKKYEEEKQKLRDNLPDVSLLDVDSSLEDIERERRRIIENQAVRAKRIDSWIKSGKHPGEVPDDLLELGNVSLLEGSSLDASLSAITDFVASVSNSDDIVSKFSATSVDTETCTGKLAAEGKFRKPLSTLGCFVSASLDVE